MSSLIHQNPVPDGDSMHWSINDYTAAGNQHLKFPPGLRFRPDDDVLVVNFLQPKILNQPLPPDPDIPVINLYSHDPNDLSEEYPVLKNETVFYILTPRDRKYPNGRRPNRAAKGGYWKATGADKEIFHGEVGTLVGFKKTLVFYQGKAPGGQKTDWIMHEYRAKDACHVQQGAKDMKLDDWVLCRLFKKKHGNKPVRDSHDGWDNPPLEVLVDADVAAIVPVAEEEEGAVSSLYSSNNIECLPAPADDQCSYAAVHSLDGDLDDVFEDISKHFMVLECPDQPVPPDFMGNQIQPGHGNSNIATSSQGEHADLQHLIMSSDFTWEEMAKATSGCSEGGRYEGQMASAGPNLTSAQALPTSINHMSTPKEAEAHHWSSEADNSGCRIEVAPADINLTSTQVLQMDHAHTNYISTQKEAEPHQWSSEAADNGYGVQMASACNNYAWTGQEGTQWSGLVNLSCGVYMGPRPPYANHEWPGQEGSHWSSGNDNGAYGIQMMPAYTTNHVWIGQGGTHGSRGSGSSADGVQVGAAAYSNCMSVGHGKGAQWSGCGYRNDDGHPRKTIRLDNDHVVNVGPSVPPCCCSFRQ